jgi:hypothetical protein
MLDELDRRYIDYNQNNSGSQSKQSRFLSEPSSLLNPDPTMMVIQRLRTFMQGYGVVEHLHSGSGVSDMLAVYQVQPVKPGPDGK